MKTQKENSINMIIYLILFHVFIIMYLKMHYYKKNYDVFFFSCFHNYVSKKCIARRTIFSFSVAYFISKN